MKLTNAPTVGILGGGQLAQMLAEAALRLGLEPQIYVESKSAPAANLASRLVEGTVNDPQLRDFLTGCSVVAFENEFLDVTKLKAASVNLTSRFAPSLDALKPVQDKLEQKSIFTRLGLATAKFVPVKSAGDLPEVIRGFNGACVLKWSRQGYDGKGVLVLRADSPLDLAERFFRDGQARGAEIYAELRVDFAHELAITAVRSQKGDLVFYPLVRSENTGGICRHVEGQAVHIGGQAEHQRLAETFARKIGEALNLTGSFSLELFQLPSGDLLINELAPRVHNSAHYSQDACQVDQFANHWLAILDQPLGNPDASPFFAMTNLLGPPGAEVEERYYTLPAAPPDLAVHWYRKSELRPGRKLGHVNIVAHDRVEFAERLAELANYVKVWEQSVVDCAKNT